MKKNYLLSLFLLVFTGFGLAQPTVLQSSLFNVATNTTPNSTNVRLGLNTVGTFKQVRFLANTGGSFTWAFHQGTAAVPDYSTNWRPNDPAGAAGSISLNSYNHPFTNINAARCNSGIGTDGNLPSITSGRYYTFNVANNAGPCGGCTAPPGSGGSCNSMEILETTFNPVIITGFTQAPGTFGSLNVSITTSVTPNAAENIFVRYTTTGYINSTIVQATGSGTSWTANIPWQTAAVSYYVYTSSRSLAAINSDVAVNGQSAHDMATLNLSGGGSWTPASGAIIVSSAGGSFNPPIGYASLTNAAGAFAALNTASAGTGAVTILVTADVATEAGTNALNASANWSSINMQPGGARTLSGTFNGPLTDLNGANNVTFDGLNSGGNTLTISNTNTGSLASTIRFINDASNNTITRCTLSGSTGAALSGLGTVFFSTGIATGNDNNTVSFCNIGPAGANLPLNAIYSLGTSAVIDNSGNSILNNNIFDFFNAGLISNGINVSGFNSGWAINNNSFYQSASRAVTTANTYNAINITSGTGYTINNNIIGGSDAAAGGSPWAMTSALAARFIAINLAAAAGSVCNVQNNTFTNFTLTTSSGATTLNGIICGINLSSTASVNVGTTTGNTIGASSGIDIIKATSTTTGGLVVAINSSATGTVAISNNTIGSLSSSGTTAAVAGSIDGINISGVAASMTITNNSIGNSTANNLRGGTSGLTTGSSLVAGIIFNSSPTGTVNTTGNTIQNLSSFGTGTGFVRGIQTPAVGGGTTTYNFTSNIINNLTTNNTLTTISNGQCGAEGITISGGANCVASLNTISNISNTNVAATASFVAGIGHGNASNTSIFRNKIYGLSNAGTSVTTTAPSEAVGIIIRSGTASSPVLIYNNMISLGNGQTTNTAFIGIQGNHGSAPDPIDQIYFNSINIEGTVAAGAQPSFGIARTDFSAVARTPTMDIRNNIVTNTRSGGAGQHFAIANNFGAVATATGWGANASNYNVLNAVNPATVGYWTAALTFAAWKTASVSDPFSVSGVTVPYTSTPVADLHLSFGVTPTQIESGAIAIAGITNDFDNQVRPGPAGSVNGGALSPDMGADEIDAVPLDLFPPAISYSLLLNNNCTTTRAFTATIADNSGVNTTIGTRPRIYFKKSTDVNNFVGNTSADNGWKFVEASNTISPFNFTINYSIINTGAVAVGDIIQYFVVAQDLSPAINVGINSGTFAATPTSVALTGAAFPIGGVPNSYSIVTGLAASMTIGAAGTFTSLTGAAGLFAAINANGLTGNTTINIIDASVTETGAVALNQIQSGDCSATNYTLLIKPAAAATTLTGSLASSALIRILSNNVTIDGSFNGSGSRDLTITNTSVTSPTVILLASTGTTPITNSSVKNNIIINGAQTATAVVVSDVTLGSVGYFNNISVLNNDIRQAFIGCYNIAVPAAGNGSGLNISNNLLNTGAIGATSIRRVGIYIQGVDGATVSGNTIGNFEVATAESDYGVWLATGTVNTTVSNNIISNLGCTAASGFAPSGIFISTSVPSANVSITGNTISGMSSAGGTAGTSTNGIFMGFATSGVTISRNNITNIKNTSATGWGASGIQLASSLTAANCTVSNNFVSDVAAFGLAVASVDGNGLGISVNSGAGYNIYHNSVNMTTNQTLVTGLPAAFFVSSGVTIAGAINLRNNIFVNAQTLVGSERYSIYSSAANTVFAAIDNNDYYSAGPDLGFIGVNRVALADIVTGFGGNTNSLNFNPVFTSAADLHLLVGNAVLKSGASIGIATDIDGNLRNLGLPTMGADEVYIPNLWAGNTSTAWGTNTNWDDANVPPVNQNITIPAGVPNMPALNAATIVNNLTYLGSSPTLGVSINGQSLTLNGTITGTGQLTGSSASNLTINGVAGTLNFMQTSATTRSLSGLVLSGSSATLGTGALNIYGIISLAAGASLNMADQPVTLKSTANGALGTASISDLTGCTMSNANKLTVERYIDNPQRSWHLLSGKGVYGPQTIFNSWQQGGAVVANKGTWITSTLFTGANGFDATNMNLSSIITHNQGGGGGPSWNYTLANTNTTTVSSFQGYMLFVRGDRTCLPSNALVTSTVLSRTDTLVQGLQSVFISSTGTGRTLVGNPYPSPIDMETVFATTTNLAQDMYIWDPSLTGNYGVGGFRLVQRTAPGVYQQTPVVLGGGPFPDATARYIHSGQAFFLRTTGTAGVTDATVNFIENYKVSTVSVVNPIVPTVGDQQLITNLLIRNTDNVASLADGIRVRFDRNYSAGITDDIEKMANFAENISSYRSGKKLIVEKRPMIQSVDTIFLRITNAGIKDYSLQLGTIDFVQTELPAMLEDNYLHTTTKIDLQGSITNYDFSVTADPASSATDRFMIVFGKGKIDVPVVITGTKGISVYPNPVGNKMLTLQFNDMVKGIYQLRLINTVGQVVMTQQVSHNGGSSTQMIGLDKNATNGNYRLEIIKPDNSRVMKALVIIDN